MADLFDIKDQAELREHFAACAQCAAEFEETLNAMARIEPAQRVCASPDFKERTMNKLAVELNGVRAARSKARGTPVLRLAVAAGFLLVMVLALPGRGPVALLAQSVQAMNGIHSVHILARMRTPPGDNFESIGAEYDFQPVEMWKEFGAAPRWRVENPGRVVVMDGQQSTLFMKPDLAVHGGRFAGFVEWLGPLLDPEQVLTAEIRAAQKGEARAGIRQEGARITLTSTRKAGGESVNGSTKNSSVSTSDHTRIYQFDASTHRLTGLQVILHDNGRNVVVFEITGIRYNETIAPEVFALTVPDGVVWEVSPEQMSVKGTLPVTARDAAVAFLEGLAQSDWDRVLAVYPATAIPESLRSCGGSFQVISIGEPVQSGLYSGWFVPYEIRWVDGHIKVWNLAVRNDNPAHRWVQDGGF
jgi:outer membrane lipoprotein-sorting protein